MTIPHAHRRSSRHLVELPCEVVTSRRDTPQLLWATDLSCAGMWLEAAIGVQEHDLCLGQELVVCFRPAVWWRASEVAVFARVARRSGARRDGDGEPGVGVCFLDLAPHESWGLRRWLRLRPERPPLRRWAARKPLHGPVSDHPFAARVCY